MQTFLSSLAVLGFLFQAPQGVDWIQQISNKPLLDMRTFQFTVAPGVALTGGVTTPVVLPYCPYGVNGSDADHWVYLSGGNGAAEAVLITGGTCTSGTTNKTIIIRPVNNHTGAWTIKSATNGIQEAAQQSIALGGAQIYVPVGTWIMHSQVALSSSTMLNGAGQGSVLQLAAQVWPNPIAGPFSCNTVANYACLITNTWTSVSASAHRIIISNLLIDMNGANQTNISNGADIFLQGCVDCSVSYVTDINSKHTGGFGFSVIDGSGPNPSVNNTWDHNTIHGFGAANVSGGPGCGGAIFIQSSGGHVTNNYADYTCDAPYVAQAGPGIVISNNVWNFGSGNLATLVGNVYTAEGAHYVTITGNTCNGPANGACFAAAWAGGPNTGSDHVTISDNICFNTGIQACGGVGTDNSGTSVVSDVTFSGNIFSSTILMSLFSGSGPTTITNINITGNVIDGCAGTGILIFTGTAHVNISGNEISNCMGGAGINIFSSTASDVSITGNLIHGNSGGDISDVNNIALICGNKTDSSWNGECNGTQITYTTPTVINGTNQNVNTTPQNFVNIGGATQIIVAGPTGSFSIGGFTSPAPGRAIYLYNSTGQTMTITNQDSGSTAANRIITPTAGTITVKVATLVYASGLSRWVVQSYQ